MFSKIFKTGQVHKNQFCMNYRVGTKIPFKKALQSQQLKNGAQNQQVYQRRICWCGCGSKRAELHVQRDASQQTDAVQNVHNASIIIGESNSNFSQLLATEISHHDCFCSFCCLLISF